MLSLGTIRRENKTHQAVEISACDKLLFIRPVRNVLLLSTLILERRRSIITRKSDNVSIRLLHLPEPLANYVSICLLHLSELLKCVSEYNDNCFGNLFSQQTRKCVVL